MNRIVPEKIDPICCPAEKDATAINERFLELLGDESRLRAESAEAIYFPENETQLSSAIAEINESDKKCVISAGRTGIAGAAAPIDAQAVVTLTKMNQVLAFGKDGEDYYVRCEPGVTLAELAEVLRKKQVVDLPGATEKEKTAATEFAADPNLQLWFPVDPTEMTAHVGGVTATNASGARTFRYGAVRNWVRSIRAVFANGSAATIKRGAIIANEHTFDLDNTIITLPAIEMPKTKCTCGYYSADDMDLIDLLVGSEGTLCAFSEIELKLAKRPESTIGVLAVVENEEKAIDLAIAARTSEAISFEAIEYFDHDALSLLKKKKEADGAGSEIPDIPNWDGAAVYLEITGTEEETEEACMELEELLGSVGSSIDDTWAAMESDELERQKVFRHMVPESVNLYIGQRAAQIPGLHKVGTDMAVPDEALREIFTIYRKGLAESGLDSVVFGHIGNNHVHVNILPKNLDELKKAKELYLGWAKETVRLGGAVAAEHGIGRIKKGMLEIQYAPEVLKQMRAIRKGFDPKGTLAPGVLV